MYRITIANGDFLSVSPNSLEQLFLCLTKYVLTCTTLLYDGLARIVRNTKYPTNRSILSTLAQIQLVNGLRLLYMGLEVQVIGPYVFT